MKELNVNVFGVAYLGFALVILVVAAVLWFFLNRASSRANEQVALLEALLEQQKRQNALLRKLCEANIPETEPPASNVKDSDKQDDFIRLVAER